MITLLIADDEKNIRAGIIKILSESLSDLEQNNIDTTVSFIEAKNGEDAFEKVLTNNPDLIITDIRMPKMTGIEFMAQLRASGKTCPIIVLSGFDDFLYAKQAIEFGATSYILKPVDKTELITAVEKQIAEIIKNRKRQTESLIRETFSEGRIIRKDEVFSLLEKQQFYYVLISGSDIQEFIAQAFLDIPYYCVEEKKNEMHFLVPSIHYDFLQQLRLTTGMWAAVSSVFTGVSNVKVAYRQARTASYARFVITDQCFPSFYQPEPSTFNTDEVANRMARVMALLGSGNIQGMSDQCDALFSLESFSVPESCAYLYSLYTQIKTNVTDAFWNYSEDNMYLMLKNTMLETLSGFTSLQDWRTNVRDYLVYLDSLIRRDHVEHPFVQDALSFIAANYTKDINMAIVANHVSVNYTYFSEKFKEHTGMNFNDYIKKLRIAEAKRLLEKGCYKVYEVSERAGFGDVKYFMKTFKEVTGISPGEYKRKNSTD